MDQILALRPFVPARDFDQSRRFYQALGFVQTLEAKDIVILKLASFSFILQRFYVKEFVENYMLQLLVRDVDAWWQEFDFDRLVAEFGVQSPAAPAIRSWGMKVGFIFDPSGVLWHVAEASL